MKKQTLFLAALLCAASVRADDLTGRLGVGGGVGAAIPTGPGWVLDHNNTGLGLGGWVRYGIDEHWGANLAYDNLAFSQGTTRIEPVTLSGIYVLAPESAWNPNVHLGVGVDHVRNVQTGRVTDFGATVGLGVDRFLTKCFSVGATFDWFSASHKNAADANAGRLGLTAGLWFGGEPKREMAAAAPASAPAQAASAAAPARTPASAPAMPAEKVSISLDVQFETSKSVVKPEYDAELQKVVDFLKAYPSSKAEIEGHTDNEGGAEFNTALSQRRADAVRQALIDRFGADGSRLSAKGYGPTQPIADNGTAEGRAKNRRVVATFIAIKN